MSGEGRTGRAAVVDALAVLALVAAAFALRAVYLREVFAADGSIVFPDPDALYHARRALFGVASFPAVLSFDPYLHHPEGAPVPWPPLYDWLLAAKALALGGSLHAFERVLAWASPVLGALAVLPVYAIARMLAGRGVALAAGAVFAALPIAVYYARVGNPDHHAWSALVGATFLALSLAALRPESRGRSLAWIGAGLLVLRAALVTSWAGSLLYVAVGEAALLLGACLAARTDLLRVQAAGALGAAALAAPVVAASGVPAGGPFSTTTLSWFHVCALAGAGLACAALAALEWRRPARGLAQRLARAAALGVLAAGVLLAFPAPRRALLPSAGFIAGTDAWSSAGNPETRALFGPPIAGAVVQRAPAATYYGWFAYALPLGLAAALWRARTRARRAPAAAFSLWTAVLGAFAVSSIRFGPDFAPSAAVALALALGEARQAAARALPGGVATALLAALAAAALLWPPAPNLWLPHARSLWRGRPAANVASSPFASLLAFGRSVRAATPETPGFLAPDGDPAYGVLVEASLGHALRYASRRAVPADNFGVYVDPARLAEVNRFFAARSEAEAVEITAHLATPYVVTALHSVLRAHAGTLQRRLHERDGSAAGEGAHLEHFRLVTEGPKGGLPFLPLPEESHLPPYKLFERVAGAVLEAHAPPGEAVRAELPLETPGGRRFVFRAAARADAEGVARLRVPYATEPVAPTRASGLWRVHAPGGERAVAVSERDVVDGRVVPVGAR
jgi:dolichyl-diphosphooligosaccharide--protein glycosyltransferase